ncbi:GNAT family N-acetyltransferase [Vibrio sp. STUT-A11]|uniref:GNAT family N-acetyltransferase n=1 Tax=Vibrio sp. STUT-A11 TaxID=2976236 RepID=UPI00222F2B94|nr:GNAT family N-acetyltransferase [Vibrio sp. STUT-A11]BDR16177.1 ribosomal-protein-serine acetyltransferase [Vibrio sp. STUT-A11]
MLQADNLQQRAAISDRISMEPLASKHTLELLETVNANRERLTVYLPWPEFVTNRREARHYISQRVDSNAVDAYWFAIYFDDRFAGVIGSKGVDPETRATEIAYWLADHGRGNQLIDQVLSILILYLKKKGNAQSIQFHCLEENTPSIRIAERTGAKLKHYLDHEFDMLDRSQRLGVYELPLR